MARLTMGLRLALGCLLLCVFCLTAVGQQVRTFNYRNCSAPYEAGSGSGVPARVRRMASRAPIARRRAVSMTERMSA